MPGLCRGADRGTERLPRRDPHGFDRFQPRGQGRGVNVAQALARIGARRCEDELDLGVACQNARNFNACVAGRAENPCPDMVCPPCALPVSSRGKVMWGAGVRGGTLRRGAPCAPALWGSGHALRGKEDRRVSLFRG